VEEYLLPDGRFEAGLQGLYVMALAFAMVPPEREAELVSHLVGLIHSAGDHLDTGFLSTPYLLDVLWDHGQRGLARTLLFQDTCPSWLYEVKMGATTIWESWHAIHEDGTPEFTSLNHYAFGCVADWMMRRLAGIRLLTPGYETSAIAPDLDGPLDAVKAHIDTPFGRLAVDWRRTGDTAEVTIDVPPGTVSSLHLDAGWTWAAEPLPTIEPGHHVVPLKRRAAVPGATLRIANQTVSGPRGPVPVRTYVPENPKAGLVWLHGGAFRFGDLDMPEADWVSRRVAEAGVAVVSVDYRLAVPGVHFPVPGDDALAVWRWVTSVGPFGVAPENWSVGGASAGGNLASALALMCRDGLAPLPRQLLPVYPVLHSQLPEPGPELAARLADLPPEARFTPEGNVELNIGYVGDPALLTHPYAFPAYGDLHALPPTLIVIAEVDDLRPSGEAFGDALAEAGVAVEVQLEPGTIHGYLNLADNTARRTVDRLVARLVSPA
jgi:acetyl esterase/lipase